MNSHSNESVFSNLLVFLAFLATKPSVADNSNRAVNTNQNAFMVVLKEKDKEFFYGN